MTRYRLRIPAPGVPRMSPSHGSLGWSSSALLLGDDDVCVVDTGGPGYRAKWDGWLAEAGLTRDDVTLVFLTHCHWDHIGGASWFPRARRVVGRTELDWAASASGDPYLEPAMVGALAASPAVVRVDPGDDLGGVRAVDTAGHTPGHLSYSVDTDAGPVLIVGDAIKNVAELRGGPFAIAWDPDRSAASRDVIRVLAERGHRLLLGHDALIEPGEVD